MNEIRDQEPSQRDLSDEEMEFLDLLDRGEVPAFFLEEIRREANKLFGCTIFNVEAKGTDQ